LAAWYYWKIADKVAMIHNGKIIGTGPAGDINTSHNDFMQQFIHGQIGSTIENQAQAYL
jgi:phospholipid/cholesterol/gamma-HCH transport system ATP-binding protein